MASRAFITAALAGVRARLPDAQLGPVTHALAAMRAADPERQRIRTLCAVIADRIEADLALLDAFDGGLAVPPVAARDITLGAWGGQPA